MAATTPSHGNASSHTDLDSDIINIRSQIKALSRRRSTLTSHLLSTHSKKALLQQHTAHSHHPTSAQPHLSPDAATPLLTAISDRSQRQAQHTQQCLYRLGAGATMFEVKDPDPHSLDDGRVFGVRIEAFTHNKFLPPYYLLLNRPIPSSSSLQVHRHTIPPCIPLPALINKYLPPPTSPPASSEQDQPQKSLPKQSLHLLVRALRQELASYHLRLAAISTVQHTLGIAEGTKSTSSQVKHGLMKLSFTDAEGKDIRLVWRDGKVGRARIGKDGRLLKCVVFGQHGRHMDVERKLLGRNGTVEHLTERLREVATMDKRKQSAHSHG
ncbi:MAG: hypothetical protein M1833_003169 [Piccolia ochrophora]|nr:MAG: hypothetical protein M1833_003169 [Piccolia ochrophora]